MADFGGKHSDLKVFWGRIVRMGKKKEKPEKTIAETWRRVDSYPQMINIYSQINCIRVQQHQQYLVELQPAWFILCSTGMLLV